MPVRSSITCTAVRHAAEYAEARLARAGHALRCELDPIARLPGFDLMPALRSFGFLLNRYRMRKPSDERVRLRMRATRGHLTHNCRSQTVTTMWVCLSPPDPRRRDDGASSRCRGIGGPQSARCRRRRVSPSSSPSLKHGVFTRLRARPGNSQLGVPMVLRHAGHPDPRKCPAAPFNRPSDLDLDAVRAALTHALGIATRFLQISDMSGLPNVAENIAPTPASSRLSYHTRDVSESPRARPAGGTSCGWHKRRPGRDARHPRGFLAAGRLRTPIAVARLAARSAGVSTILKPPMYPRLEDLRDFHLQLRRRHLDTRVTCGHGVADAGQHVGNRISHLVFPI